MLFSHLFLAGGGQLIYCSLMLPLPVHSYYISSSERGTHCLVSASSHSPSLSAAQKADACTCSWSQDSCLSQEMDKFVLLQLLDSVLIDTKPTMWCIQPIVNSPVSWSTLSFHSSPKIVLCQSPESAKCCDLDLSAPGKITLLIHFSRFTSARSDDVSH